MEAKPWAITSKRQRTVQHTEERLNNVNAQSSQQTPKKDEKIEQSTNRWGLSDSGKHTQRLKYEIVQCIEGPPVRVAPYDFSKWSEEHLRLLRNHQYDEVDQFVTTSFIGM